MTRPDTYQLWEALRAAAVRYSIAKYGVLPTAVSLTLPTGQHVEPIRPLSIDELALDPKTEERKP